MYLHADVVTVNGVAVIAVADRETAGNLKVIRDYAIDVVGFYNSLLGFYPHPYIVIIPGAEPPTGGCPVDTGVIRIHGLGALADKSPNYWKWLVAHEVAHMYWGYYVRDAEKTGWSQLGWLTIGLGMYLDKQFIEARSIDYRVHDSLVAAFRKAEKDGLEVAFGKTDNEIRRMSFDYNTIVIHGRSFAIVEEIEMHIGKTVFDQVFRAVLQDYAYKEISFPLLREFIFKSTGKDIGFIVKEYADMGV
jgi:hypothetical protein